MKRIGKIEARNLPELLHNCYLQKKSAIIDLQQDEIIKSLYLEGGNIVFARSNQRSDRLGEFLVKKEMVQPDDLKNAANILNVTCNKW